MPRYIDADKCPCINCYVSYCYKNCKEYNDWFDKGVDVAPVILSKWKFVAYTFYYDEEYSNGCVYVLAKCGNCGSDNGKGSIYSRTIFRKDEDEFRDGWRFDEEAEKEKALESVKMIKLPKYCNECGARMDLK